MNETIDETVPFVVFENHFILENLAEPSQHLRILRGYNVRPWQD